MGKNSTQQPKQETEPLLELASIPAQRNNAADPQPKTETVCVFNTLNPDTLSSVCLCLEPTEWIVMLLISKNINEKINETELGKFIEAVCIMKKFSLSYRDYFNNDDMDNISNVHSMNVSLSLTTKNRLKILKELYKGEQFTNWAWLRSVRLYLTDNNPSHLNIGIIERIARAFDNTADSELLLPFYMRILAEIGSVFLRFLFMMTPLTLMLLLFSYSPGLDRKVLYASLISFSLFTLLAIIWCRVSCVPETKNIITHPENFKKDLFTVWSFFNRLYNKVNAVVPIPSEVSSGSRDQREEACRTSI